jgi:hypothetical protein
MIDTEVNRAVLTRLTKGATTMSRIATDLCKLYDNAGSLRASLEGLETLVSSALRQDLVDVAVHMGLSPRGLSLDKLREHINGRIVNRRGAALRCEMLKK